jgi:CRISPR-associated protein Cas2
VAFWVLDLENGPPRVRGALARWAIEVRAGLYVGATSAKTRDGIWKIVDQEIAADSRAVLVFPSASRPMGFEVRTIGIGRREVVDLDGLLLAKFLPEVEARAASLAPQKKNKPSF